MTTACTIRSPVSPERLSVGMRSHWTRRMKKVLGTRWE